MPLVLDPHRPLGKELLSEFAASIDSFLASQRELVADVGAEPILTQARAFTSGGKRLRPAFALWAYVAANGEVTPAVVQAAASLDLLHVSALIHDDIIDGSATRRGLPAAHVYYASQHRADGGRGDEASFGQAAAILLGDVLSMWSVEMFEQAELPSPGKQLASAQLSRMRSEVMCGQYLDIAAAYGMAGAASLTEAHEVARRVLEYKSARYSVARPVQIGASLADASPEVIAGLAAFGSGVGRAFQLRDDLLGVFGDEAKTGKPAGDDIREGKRTFLVLAALAEANPTQHDELNNYLGNAELSAAELAQAREIITETGAVASVETMIEAETATATAALADLELSEPGRLALTRLAELSTSRDH